MLETTLVIIKPNGVRGGLIGEIVGRYEKARLAVAGMRLRGIARLEAEGFYAEHKGKGFFAELVGFMSSGPAVILALNGENAVEAVRQMNGATNPKNALPGTIRHDFAPSTGENVVHASDSPQSAAREVAFWFRPEELASYAPRSHVLG
jgi:nucleoside-diphosphate kinase